MKKKGFTLIEIIISLSLITIFGVSSIVGIKYVNKNIRISKLDEITDKALLAAKVYIETNKETYNQLYQKQNAVIIPLNVLVNEGLLSLENTDLKKNDYEDEYIVTALTDTKGEGCIDITTNASWNLSKDNPIYICTSSSDDGGTEDSVKNELKIDTLYQELTYTAKGENPNNWVEFEVISDNTKVAYFPNEEDKSLWRILSIDGEGVIKLFYPKPIPCNNDLVYDKNSYNKYSDTYYYKLQAFNSNTGFFPSSEYYRYMSDDKWNGTELVLNVDVEYSKQKALYENIINKDWIVDAKYQPYYTAGFNYTSGSVKQQTGTKTLKIGMLSQNEINSSINIATSWLYNYSTLIGYGRLSQGLQDWVAHMYSSKGNLDYSTAGYEVKGSRWRFYTYDFHPVISLNNKVDLVKQLCPNGIELGSKECPYKLECKNC